MVEDVDETECDSEVVGEWVGVIVELCEFVCVPEFVCVEVTVVVCEVVCEGDEEWLGEPVVLGLVDCVCRLEVV